MAIIKPQKWEKQTDAASQYIEGKSNVWIPYPRGEELLQMMQTLMDSPPSHRPECRLIYGDSNVGKTSIAIEFAMRANGGPPNPNGGINAPVLCVETPANASLNMFYSLLLRPFKMPKTPDSLDKKALMVLDRLPALGVRMIVVDEIHNVLNGTYDKRKEFLTGLKSLTNQLRIPMVLIGTDPARSAIQVDPQLGNRFVPIQLDGWVVDKEYGRFISMVFEYWGLDAKDLIRTKSGLSAVYSYTAGLTGEAVSLARALARKIESQRGLFLTREREIYGQNPSDDLVPISINEFRDLVSAIRWSRPEERRMG